MGGIAELAVLALIENVKYPFHVSVVHLRSVLRVRRPLLITRRSLLVEVPSLCRSMDRRGSRRMHDLEATL